MSAFGIFALILTIAYIIYFSVVIVRDVAAGRKSGYDSSQLETFDTSFMEEQSVKVTETEEGFSVENREIAESPIVEMGSRDSDKPEDQNDEADAMNAKLSETMPEAVEVIADVTLDENEMMDSIQGYSDAPDAKRIWVKRISAEENSSTSDDADILDHY